MFKNFLLAALRSFWRFRLYALLNVLVLSVGIAIATYLLLLLQVQAAAVGSAASLSGAELAYQRWVLPCMAAAILLLSAINFGGMLFDRLSTRRHEVAVRKALGSSKRELFIQLFLESLLLSGMAAFGAMMLLELFLPLLKLHGAAYLRLQDLSLFELPWAQRLWMLGVPIASAEQWVFLGATLMALSIGACASLYPVYALLQEEPAYLLRRGWFALGRYVRQAMVVGQLMLMSALLVLIWVQGQQLQLLGQKNTQLSDQLADTQLFLAYTIGCQLVVGCGLFGMSFFQMRLRRKSIAVRKALGASDASLFWWLSKDFLWQWALALGFGLPMGYALALLWSARFSWVVPIAPMSFVWSAAMLLLLLAASVGMHVYGASRRSPVEDLQANG